MKRYFILYEFLAEGVTHTRTEVRKVSFARLTLAEVEAEIAKELNVPRVHVRACNKV